MSATQRARHHTKFKASTPLLLLTLITPYSNYTMNSQSLRRQTALNTLQNSRSHNGYAPGAPVPRTVGLPGSPLHSPTQPVPPDDQDGLLQSAIITLNSQGLIAFDFRLLSHNCYPSHLSVMLESGVLSPPGGSDAIIKILNDVNLDHLMTFVLEVSPYTPGSIRYPYHCIMSERFQNLTSICLRGCKISVGDCFTILSRSLEIKSFEVDSLEDVESSMTPSGQSKLALNGLMALTMSSSVDLELLWTTLDMPNLEELFIKLRGPALNEFSPHNSVMNWNDFTKLSIEGIIDTDASQHLTRICKPERLTLSST